MRVYVNVENKKWNKYDIDFQKIADTAVGAKYKNAEVSITLVNDRIIRRINKKYRGLDRATNVLSFELGDDILLGDIFISLDTVKREARAENISISEHTAHMIVHGILHLLGYDHIKDVDAEKMEKRETIILKKLGYKNPYTAESAVCINSECCPGGKTIGFIRRFFNGAFGRSVLFALCAMFAAFGFAPFHFWWATVIGIGGAYILSVKTLSGIGVWRRFWCVFVFGAFYAMAMFWWVLNSIYVVPELANEFAVWTVPALLGIGIVGGVFFGIPFVAITGKQVNPVCRPILFATVWTLILWMREWIFTGFPWNPIANIFVNNLYVANSMSLYGALGLTFVIIGIIGGVCEIIMSRRNARNWFVTFLFVLFGIVGVLYGVKNVRASACESESPVIRIVQPARSAAQKATYSRSAAMHKARENIELITSLAGAEGEYDLVVFPETAYPFVVMDDDIISIPQILERPIIIGSNYFNNRNLYNSLLTVNASGTISHVYSKSHLVPFGEYRPFGNIIPTPGLLTAGNGSEVIDMDINGEKFIFAPAVCYEIIFSDSVIPKNKTPNAIVNITNDNWFGKTPGTYQHMDMVRRYAIESGVPIIRANYSGISAFVAADGRIISAIPVGQAGIADGTVCGAHKTLYRYIGRDMCMIIILVIACLMNIWIYSVARRK